MRAIFTRDGNIFTTGFTRMSQRELGLWDPVMIHNSEHDLLLGGGGTRKYRLIAALPLHADKL